MTRPSSHRVSIITIAYQSDAVIGDMLASLPRNSDIIIINNAASTSEFLRNLANSYQAKLICNSNNAGFGAACNQGAEMSEREFLFFLNPDASIAPDCLDVLVTAMDARPDASAANPRIVTPQGKSQYKYRSVLLPKREWASKTPPSTTAETPVLQGNALLVRRIAFNQIGGFDSRIFMYHEDDDLSIQLRKQIGPLLAVPEAIAYHRPGSSSPRSAEIAYMKGFYLGNSRLYALRKYGFPIAKLNCLMHAMIQLLNPMVLVLHRKRMKSLGYLIGTLKDW